MSNYKRCPKITLKAETTATSYTYTCSHNLNPPPPPHRPHPLCTSVSPTALPQLTHFKYMHSLNLAIQTFTFQNILNSFVVSDSKQTQLMSLFCITISVQHSFTLFFFFLPFLSTLCDSLESFWNSWQPANQQQQQENESSETFHSFGE